MNKNHYINGYISYNDSYISSNGMADTTLFTATYVGMVVWNVAINLWFLFMHYVKQMSFLVVILHLNNTKGHMV